MTTRKPPQRLQRSALGIQVSSVDVQHSTACAPASTVRNLEIQRPSVPGRRLAGMLLILALIASPAALFAQDNQPANGNAPAGPAPPPPGADDPVVQALLETNPTTPPQLTSAIETLLNLGYPEMALPLVKRLQEANLDDAARYALVKQFGSDTFLRMGREPKLAPDGAALATSVIEGASNYAQAPDRLAQLIDQIAQGDEAARRSLAIELRSGGAASVNALLNALADEARADSHDALFEALILQASNALGPATAAIEAPEPRIQAVAARVLGYVGDRSSLKHLVGLAVDPTVEAAVREAAQDALRRLIGTVPTREQAITYLENEARRAYDGTPPERPSPFGLVEVWVWDPETSGGSPRVAPTRIAAVISAQQLATRLYPLDPERPAVIRLFLSTLLERAAYDQGLDQRLEPGPGSVHEIVASFEMPVLLDVLAAQLREGHTVGATALVRILGDIGSTELLYHRSPLPSLIAEAASHPDPRLRFAAVEALMKLAPQDWRFPGASQITHGIEHFANFSGTLRGVIADTIPQKAQNLAGLLAELGYETALATNGRDAVLQSVSSADVAFILLDTTLPNAPPDILIQKIRRDPRAAWLPVALLAPVNQLEEVRRLSQRFPRTAVFVRPHNPDAMKLQMDELMATVAYEFVGPEERLAQAQAALRWLAELAREPNHRALYDLRRLDAMLASVIYVPELTADAAAALATLGTHRAQLSLVEFASTNALPLASRQAAAEAFRAAVERDGVLLHPHEVLRQYDRYNASERLDAGTQAVLGSILDTIEAPVTQNAADDPQAMPPVEPQNGEGPQDGAQPPDGDAVPPPGEAEAAAAR